MQCSLDRPGHNGIVDHEDAGHDPKARLKERFCIAALCIMDTLLFAAWIAAIYVFAKCIQVLLIA